MDVICVDGKFPEDAKQFWTKYGVVWPEQGKMYTIRDVIKNTNGDTGLLLEELVNPKVPIKHPILGWVQYEPNWNINRFSTLKGDAIDREALKDIIKNSVIWDS
jgi:hypothetical protein